MKEDMRITAEWKGHTSWTRHPCEARPTWMACFIDRTASRSPVKMARENLREIFGEHFTVSDKIETILARVSNGGSLKFSELFAQMASRVEIVVTFLALLELVRLRQIRAVQTEEFQEIEIHAAAI